MAKHTIDSGCRPIPRPTFAELVALELRLAQLMAEARVVRDDRTAAYFCANARWYGYDGQPGIKPRLSRLVGWDSGRKDILGTPTAYDVAYDALYDVLPNCRGECGCL